MTVLICAAHDDDGAIGVGGTAAKLAKQGEDVYLLVFFYGVGASHRASSWPPMMSVQKLIKTRVMETRKASKILGIKKTYFLGLLGVDRESEFDEIKKINLFNFVKKLHPDKIFYHSIKDGHPDHLFVNKVMSEIVEKLDYKPEVLTYQINMFDFSDKDAKVIYDVSDTYKIKLKSLEVFKSQILWIKLLEFMILLKGIYFGRKHRMKFAEYFYPA